MCPPGPAASRLRAPPLPRLGGMPAAERRNPARPRKHVPKILPPASSTADGAGALLSWRREQAHSNSQLQLVLFAARAARRVQAKLLSAGRSRVWREAMRAGKSFQDVKRDSQGSALAPGEQPILEAASARGRDVMLTCRAKPGEKAMARCTVRWLLLRHPLVFGNRGDSSTTWMEGARSALQ